MVVVDGLITRIAQHKSTIDKVRKFSVGGKKEAKGSDCVMQKEMPALHGGLIT